MWGWQRWGTSTRGSMFVCALLTPQPPVRVPCGRTSAPAVSPTTHTEHDFMAFLLGDGGGGVKDWDVITRTALTPYKSPRKTPLYQGPQCSLSKLNNGEKKSSSDSSCFLIRRTSLGFPARLFLACRHRAQLEDALGGSSSSGGSAQELHRLQFQHVPPSPTPTAQT